MESDERPKERGEMPVKYSSMAALITSDLLRPRLLATLSSLVKVSSSSLNVIIRITSPQRDGVRL